MKTKRNTKKHKRNTKKHKKVKRGGASQNSQNSVGSEIENFPCEEGNCHRTMEQLEAIMLKAGYKLLQATDETPIDNFRQIEHFFSGNRRVLLRIRGPRHFFYIQIKNGSFRIISSWGIEHTIHTYYTMGRYGKLQKFSNDTISYPFRESFNKYCGQNDEDITQAIKELFGVTITDSKTNPYYKKCVFILYNMVEINANPTKKRKLENAKLENENTQEYEIPEM